MATADPMADDRKRQIAAACWRKASEAMAKENWDFAIEMLGQCATLVPDNLVYRQTLRGNEHKKYKGNKTGATMSGMRLMGVRSKVKKHRGAKNWKEMDQAAEEGLTVNPWDAQLNADLGEATGQMGCNDVSVWAYEMAVGIEPKNKDFLKGLAEARARKHDYIGAGNCWRKIYELDPMDGQARTMIQAMDSQAAIHKGGFEHAESTQEVRQGYEESVKGNSGDKGSVGPGESQEADLQRAIRKDPANKDNYQKLADYYRREARLEEALQWYTKAFEVGGDQVVREQGEDVQLELFKKNLDLAKEAAARNPGDEHARQGVVALAKELLDREVETFSRRTERYPKDLKLKFELAQRLVRQKNFPPAIKLLQQCSGDVRIEGPVLLLLGKVFLQQSQNGLAKRQFEKAVEKFSSADHPEQFVECHYYLGRLCEEEKNLDDAETHYSEVLAVDYGYKDAQARLEKIQAARGKGGLGDLTDI
jgi:tetratricopeptide (TPR) repeat protein